MGGVYIRNAGRIFANLGQALDLGSLSDLSQGARTVLVINDATGLMWSYGADAVRLGMNAQFTNFGSVESFKFGANAGSGVALLDNQGVIITNAVQGSIIGERGIESDGTFVLDNSGAVTGEGGSAIHMGGKLNERVSLSNQVTGVISGRLIGGAEAAIDIGFEAAIDNSGLIRATGSPSANGHSAAIWIGGGTINNAGGQIISDGRAITMDQNEGLFAHSASFRLDNSGLIMGNGEAIVANAILGVGIYNSGIIIGNIATGAGDDIIDSSLGTLRGTVFMSGGNDQFHGGAEANFARMGSGADVAHGGGGSDTLYGGEGNDQLSGDQGNDTLYGDDGEDTLYGGDGADFLYGGAGADHMEGGAGSDYYFVDNVGDVVVEAAGPDRDVLTTTVDYTLSDNVEDVVLVSATGLTVYANGLLNRIVGSNGNDVVHAEGGNDLIYAGTGNDILYGEADNDTLLGEAGNDILYGGDGNDTLYGGAGGDRLVGGAGYDRFVFTSLTDFGTGATLDHIVDLDLSIGEKIDLSAMDANTNTAGNDAFTWISTAQFSNVAGQLRLTSGGNSVTVQGDVNGDGVADFAFVVENHFGLTGGHFFL